MVVMDITIEMSIDVDFIVETKVIKPVTVVQQKITKIVFV